MIVARIAEHRIKSAMCHGQRHQRTRIGRDDHGTPAAHARERSKRNDEGCGAGAFDLYIRQAQESSQVSFEGRA